MSELSEFCDLVLSRFSERITDEVFLLIQNDKKLMKDYLDLIHGNGRQTVNSHIGKAIKLRFGLNNDAIRQQEPESTLIQSHQEFL